ncbi:SHOCT domain-containing protein [Roseomonas sp. NAR14]|uniref:SHOCT domain-containing protein n=1 Tax=Roseomonas acroporae TaxID=2937791 RepID=A0A9X2BYW7_9PROT|nr:SHOCT domain-containing protein [Roseomonas acroporae]MCK8786450.1 SHOCT domain-containing protein [Roseomonas acroporae]
MPQLTEDGRRAVDEIARNTGFGPDAVTTMLNAMIAGGGYMAQFSHPELGGMGQWSRGGMLMIGDMFNNGLKARVDQLANALSDAMQRGPLVAASDGGFMSSGGQFGGQGWWPSELGSPSSSGAQNDMRYAIFPGARRLAVLQGGQVTVYDTRDHSLYGVSQQQGGSQSLSFNSQYGTVRLEDLPVVSGGMTGGSAPAADHGGTYGDAPAVHAPEPPRDFQPQSAAFGQPAVGAPVGRPGGQSGGQTGGQDVIGLLERLATLHQNGVLTSEEFAAKKAELLGRL